MEQRDKTSQGTNGYCTACGSPLEEGVSFCTKCGNPVAGKNAGVVSESPAAAASSDAAGAAVPADVTMPVESAGAATPSRHETVMVDIESDMAREAQDDRDAAAQATEALYGVESVESAFAPNEGAPTMPDVSVQQTSTVLKKPLFIGIGIAVVLLAVVIVLVVLVFGKVESTPASDGNVAQESAPVVEQPESSDDSDGGKSESESSDPVVVNLTDSYTTRFSDVNEITYPAFTFQYPGSQWAVVSESVAVSGEYVSVENLRNGTEVSYQHWGSHPSGSAVAELEEMSDYELYLARNEIFARHGRIFKNSDLQEYFGSKSWYDPRYTPEEFSESMLNANEKDNIERMAKIEQDRNSPYID